MESFSIKKMINIYFLCSHTPSAGDRLYFVATYVTATLTKDEQQPTEN